MANYGNISRNVWAYLATHGCDSSTPYGPNEFACAREWLDSRRWIPWKRIRSVLCLACGGGQQGPLFASLGCEVTLVDLSPEQLAIDREAAERYSLTIECVEADMLNLSQLHGRNYDLVYQAVSACYVPDVRKLYQEVTQVLKPGGYYRVEHWNPVHVQLAQQHAWDGKAYRVVRPQTPGKPVAAAMAWDEKTGATSITCWHYVHPLNDLIGGLCEAGFAVLRFAESGEADASAEPGTHTHLGAYLPSFFSIFARRREVTRR
ncbi:MAG: class I SAM-dependent methyltransferase [Terriglobales bacterium]